MALNAYLKLRGQRDGDILGSATQAGQVGKIVVVTAEHALSRDAATGVPSAMRAHAPLKFTKELDRATPRLYDALVNNETLVEWELQFWRPGVSGQEEQHFTVQLFNAAIATIDFRMPDNRDPGLRELESYEGRIVRLPANPLDLERRGADGRGRLECSELAARERRTLAV